MSSLITPLGDYPIVPINTLPSAASQALSLRIDRGELARLIGYIKNPEHDAAIMALCDKLIYRYDLEI